MNPRLLIALLSAVLTHAGLGLWLNGVLRSLDQGDPEGDVPGIEVALVAGDAGGATEPAGQAAPPPPGPAAAEAEPPPAPPEPAPAMQPEPVPEPTPEPKPPAVSQPVPEPAPEPLPRPPTPAPPKQSPPEPQRAPVEHKEQPEPKRSVEPPPRQEPPEPAASSRATAIPRPPPASRPGAPGGPGRSASGAGFGGGSRARGANSGPVLISSFDPPYPSHLQQKRIGGAVVLELAIDTQGRVTSSRVAVSSGISELDQSARTAVRQWRFRPAKRDGEPIPFRATQRVVFRP